MKTMVTAAATLSLLLAPLAEASPKNGRGNGNGNGAWASGSHCPPGLANRNPECVPPGQARRGGEAAREDSGDRNDSDDAADWTRGVIEVADNDRDRDRQQALAIVGGLIGLALIERARRQAEPDTVAIVPAPVAPVAPAPSLFSFSEVPSRPASIEALAAVPAIDDAAYYGDYADALDPGFMADADDPGFVTEPEPIAAPSTRLVPLGPLPAPVPTPEEEAQLTDVFRRAANEGDTGF